MREAPIDARLGRRLKRWPTLALAAVALVGTSAQGAGTTRERSAALATTRMPDLHHEVRTHAEVLWDTGHATACFAYLDSVIGAGSSRGDTAMVLAARLWKARQLINPGKTATTSAMLDTLEREARALRATEALAWIRDTRATVLMRTTTDVPAIVARWRESARFAHAMHVPMLEGHAHFLCGSTLNYAGRYAEAILELRAAQPLLPPASATRVLLPLNLGLALSSIGRTDEARKHYLEGMELCRSRNRPEYMRYYYTNLAVIEYNENDPAAALPYLEEALRLPRLAADSAQTQLFELNRAWTIYRIGPPERGLAELRPLEAACESLGDATNLTAFHSHLSEALIDDGEYAGALRHARRAFKFAALASAESKMYASSSLARCQQLSGDLEGALATIDSVLLDHPENRRLSDLMDTRMIQIDLLLRLGRLAQAEVVARDADRAARPDGPLKGANWQELGTLLARVHRERGRPDSALAQLRRVRLDWERRRDTITRYEWRENRDASSALLFSELGLTLLDSRRRVPERVRVRQAFDALQEFQARTLEERMQGAGASARAMAHRITIDSLQRSVLRPDELLLDIVATPETTFAFAVTRTELRVRPLPGLRLLEPRVQRLMPAMESAHEGAGPEAALRWMSAEVLAPFADLLPSHSRLVVTGGGPLALLPWAALPGPDGQPLLAAHEVVVAPSATLWSIQRTAPRAEGVTHLLVLGRTTDAAGRTLEGVRQECRAVEGYAGVTSRVHPGDQPLTRLVADFDRFDAIHLAAHMYSDNMNPWRSGVLMGRGNADDAYLRASDIARRRLSARLVVLSGCQSAAARSLPGEGPQGLASAFLCAGTSTVVATLWDVRDDVAADFAARFYAALARGAGAGRALRETQMALRAAGRGPGDWAAFVAWGSGDTGLRLRRSAGARLLWGPGAVR